MMNDFANTSAVLMPLVRYLASTGNGDSLAKLMEMHAEQSEKNEALMDATTLLRKLAKIARETESIKLNLTP